MFWTILKAFLIGILLNFNLISTALQVNEQRTVTVGTAITTKVEAPCEVIIIAPSGKITGPTVTKGSDGYSFSFMSTEAGLHSVTIKYANQEIPKSPFTVIVEAKKAVTKVTVMGFEERKYIRSPGSRKSSYDSGRFRHQYEGLLSGIIQGVPIGSPG